MKTQCNDGQLELQGLGKRKIIISNDAEVSSSDGGLVLLHQLEKQYRIIDRLQECFFDNRHQSWVSHPVKTLLTQRIFGLCQGYEDLNDHDEWRKDPLLSVLCGNEDASYVAGKSTLNRLELGKEVTEEYGGQYNKISWDDEKIEELFIDLFLDSFTRKPKEIILDFDATDDPLHGEQEGRFFHGYYDCYCYLPLYVFCGPYLLTAKLRRSNIDASAGSVEVLEKIVAKIRQRFATVRIIVRGDSGFCRDKMMSYCERHGISYLFGLSRNKRLRRAIGAEMRRVKQLFEQTGEPQRQYKELIYRTRKSWSCARRVVAKVEYLRKGENPRFVVTNLRRELWPAQMLYEQIYCARGDMENRIKEQQLYLFADRTSTGWMSSNQLRLWFSSFAYMFFVLLREKALAGSEWNRSQASTLRIKLLKVSAVVKVTVRAIRVRLPFAYPYWDAWIGFSEARCFG
jgi:hypothetical protein